MSIFVSEFLKIEVYEMAHWNVAASNRSARFVLGKTVTADINSTYRKFIPKKGKMFINCGVVRYDEKDRNTFDKTAFVVGADGAFSEFTGDVIAIVKTPSRKEYWVIVPKNTQLYEPDIRFLVSDYIPESKDATFICYYEKSCGSVLFTEKDGKRYYILIKNMSGHVGFPKGHVEFGEDEHMTALRETYEETGVRANLIPGFRESYNYLINGYIKKEAIYYTSAFRPEEVKMDIMEISEYQLVTYDEAAKLLNYPHDRSILRKAHDFISGYLAGVHETENKYKKLLADHGITTDEARNEEHVSE